MNRMNDMRKSCLFRRNVFIKITQLFSFKIEVDFADQTEFRNVFDFFRIFTQRLREKLNEPVCQICEGEPRQFPLIMTSNTVFGSRNEAKRIRNKFFFRNGH